MKRRGYIQITHTHVCTRNLTHTHTHTRSITHTRTHTRNILTRAHIRLQTKHISRVSSSSFPSLTLSSSLFSSLPRSFLFLSSPSFSPPSPSHLHSPSPPSPPHPHSPSPPSPSHPFSSPSSHFYPPSPSPYSPIHPPFPSPSSPPLHTLNCHHEILSSHRLPFSQSPLAAVNHRDTILIIALIIPPLLPFSFLLPSPSPLSPFSSRFLYLLFF